MRIALTMSQCPLHRPTAAAQCVMKLVAIDFEGMSRLVDGKSLALLGRPT